ncbi:MAG: hypothetical protein JWP18_494, partial [Solirubrobacterales bacterium]|nr:hypothetical protein [Solirubrobacterales bacterium]
MRGAGGNRGSRMSRGQALRARARALASREAEAGRSRDAAAGARDMTPATGTPGGPASWRRAQEGADVALHRRDWQDARWSSIFAGVPGYAGAPGDTVPDSLVEDASA